MMWPRARCRHALSALVGKQRYDSVHPGGFGGTYGGNPVCCAAALAVLEVYEEENLLARSEKLGKKARKYFNELMTRHEVIGDVRGLGPMLALELVKDRKTKEPAPDETAAIVKIRFRQRPQTLSCGQYSTVTAP